MPRCTAVLTRRAMLAPLALALAACTETRAGAPAPREARTERDGILFAASAGDSGRAAMDPIAIVTPGGLRDPWTVAEDSAFNARYYAPGTPYAFRVAGLPAGEVAVVAPEEPVCSERIARATATATRALPARWEGLASDVFGAAPREPLLRRATDAEKAVLTALLDSIHAARGAEPGRRREARLDGLFAAALPGSAAPALVGTSNISVQYERFEQVQSAMMVAERQGSAYHPAFVWYADEREASMQRRALLDALDVDGDGSPELVTRTAYYEGWDYTVLRRTREGWSEIYQGGGGGC